MRRLNVLFIAGSALSIALAGCRVSAPGKAETTLVQWTKHHVTVGGKQDVNPVKYSPANLDEGKKIFGYYCIVCHGRDGQNTGVPFAEKMAPPLPSLASAEVQQYSDGQLKWIIENGIFPSGMPASHGVLSDEDMWKIVIYLRHLPPAGSLGEPRTYSGDEFGTENP